MRKQHILYIVVILLSIINMINTNNTSVLSYSSSVGVGFTFNPTLSVSISPPDLTIPNLSPGTTADSNIINVSVASNAAYGYTLSAIINGNNNNLTHANDTNTFSSIATESSLSSLTTDNTWGYSYKDNTTVSPTWSNYSGLSSGAYKTLLDTDANNTETGTDNIDFKIVAKASNAQASGTYTGIINFTAVTKLKPKEISDLEYLQDFADLDETDLADVKSSMPAHSVFTLKDKRDEQEYTVAKLLDTRIWMTKNLNLAGGAEITSELSDIPVGYSLPTENGFQVGNKLPVSSQTGFSDSAQAYVYNTGNNTNNCSSSGCYSYYSWTAATAGSGINIGTDNADAPYSICPRGWKLPTSKTKAYLADGSDLYQLAVAYGMNPDNTLQSPSDFYNQAGPNTIPNFLRAGSYVNSGISYANGRGYLLSRTSAYWSGGIRGLLFTTGNVDSSSAMGRAEGYPVRCLVR